MRGHPAQTVATAEERRRRRRGSSGSAVSATATGLGSASLLDAVGFGSVIVRLVTASKGVISTIKGADSSEVDEVTTTCVSADVVAVG